MPATRHPDWIKYTKPLEIRRARIDEADTLSQLCIAAKSYWGYDAQTIQSQSNELTVTADFIQSNPTFVAQTQTELAGFYQLVLAAPLVRLEHLWVHPKHMRKGIGRTLLHHASALAQTTLTFDADLHAEAFYLACGAHRIRLIAAPTLAQPNRCLAHMELPFITR